MICITGLLWDQLFELSAGLSCDLPVMDTLQCIPFSFLTDEQFRSVVVQRKYGDEPQC